MQEGKEKEVCMAEYIMIVQKHSQLLKDTINSLVEGKIQDINYTPVYDS